MNNRFFQWIAGARRGDGMVMDSIVEEDGTVYLTFKDNSRIDTGLVAEINTTDLTGKMMAEVESPTNIWRFVESGGGEDRVRYETDWESQTKYEIPSAEDIAAADLTGTSGVVQPRKKLKKIDLVPPRPTTNKFGKIANSADMAQVQVSGTLPNQPEQQQQPKLNLNDPVWLMMDKAKKFDTEVPMEITISLPSKALYNVAKESFDDGGKKVIEYIIASMSDEMIKKSLKRALTIAYEGQEPEPEQQQVLPMFTPETIDEPIIGESKLADDK